MSRKTRKLMWSVPLIAAVAVIGALAAYVMVAPGGALAHSGDSVTTAHQPPGPVTGIDVSTPTAEEGGRTMLRVTWNAPTGADMPTMYRVDMSTNASIWHNDIGGEASDDTLTESMAMSNCASDDDGNRCYTVTGLMPGTEYYFRVFAMNDSGTGPISIDETTGTGETVPVDPPAKVAMLDATDYFADQIVLTWDTPTDTGGADLKWYCAVIASSPDGDFFDPTTTANAPMCRDMANASMTAPSLNALLEIDTTYDSQVVVIPAEMERMDANGDPVEDADGNPILDPVVTWTHDELGAPDLISLRYRLYAVTEDGNDARRISRAASNTATGRTVAGPKDSPARVKKPEAPRNLRSVAYGDTLTDTPSTMDDTSDDTLSGSALNFYWNAPRNFPAGTDEDPRTWTLEVERLVPDPEDEDKSIWVPVQGSSPTVEAEADNATPQFAVDMDATENLAVTPPAYAAPTLIGTTPSSGAYRARFVNPGKDDDDADEGHQNTNPNDDVKGAWARINLSMPLDAGDHIDAAAADLHDSTLPIISKEAGNGTDDDADDVEGLRFERHPTDPKNQIVLRWMRDVNSHSVEAKQRPNGYVVDRSDDGGMTWQPMARATSPTDLGTDTVYRDRQMITPGQRYTYRVFPVVITSGNFQDDFGLPGQIAASSEQADVPDAVTGVKVVADGPRALKVNWNLLPDSKAGGHDVEGYLVQMADDTDNDLELNDPENVDWTTENLRILDVTTTTDADEGRPYTVGKDTNMYTYRPVDGDGDPTLTPGSVRWFRVFAITDENDGDHATGGNQVDIEDGGLHDGENGDAPSVGEENPTEEDEENADPARGKTDGVADPDVETDAAPPEVALDLTAEAASDTNSLGEGDRGVFLTWNQAMMPDTETDTYRIERKRMDTGVDALDNDTWQFIGRANGDTSFTDRTPLRDDGETRMYRVGSEATGQPDAVFTDPAVDYALHGAHEPDAPTEVMAESSADGTMATVSWTAPASDGGSAITGYMVQSKYGDGEWMDVDPAHTGMDMMYMDTGLMPAITYYYRVLATNAVGNSAWSDGMAMTGAPASTELTKPVEVMAESNAVGELMLTWEGGANADSFLLIAVNMVDTSDYKTADVSDGAARMGTVAGLTSGVNYLGIVVALQGTGADQPYSYGASSVQAVQ